MTTQRGKLIIVDDHQLFRDGLNLLLRQHLNYDTLIFESAIPLIDQLAILRPDVIIMDIGMSDLNGIEATRKIRKKSQKVKIIGLSMHTDPSTICRMLEAGANGYLVKDSAIDEVIATIQTVVKGGTYLSPDLIGPVLEQSKKVNHSNPQSADKALTFREKQILQMVAEGKSTSEIGLTLSINIKTVDSHRKSIMQKLNIHSIAGLTKFALKEGLTYMDS